MPIPSDVGKLRRSLARDEVYQALRRWIVDGTLRPGERIHDHNLAAHLGVSRTPVREALRRLEDEGLVETATNRWTRVAPVKVADAHNIYPLYWTLEPLAIRLAGARLDPAACDALEAANARIGAAFRAGAPDAAARADAEFHGVILVRSGNPELVAIDDGLRVKLGRIGVAYFNGSVVAEHSVDEHAAIVAALRAGDHGGAARASEAHWRASYGRFLDLAGDLVALGEAVRDVRGDGAPGAGRETA